jgi:hypothetical protein
MAGGNGPQTRGTGSIIFFYLPNVGSCLVVPNVGDFVRLDARCSILVASWASNLGLHRSSLT